uniref:Plexin B3 n=1 Tax=Gadus morhua TaxID=8049 RepID=A0A8C5A6F8_GADMO
MVLPQLLLLLLLLGPAPPAACGRVPDDVITRVELRGAPLSHLLLDPRSGQLYVAESTTCTTSAPPAAPQPRPHRTPLDSPDCLPPILAQDCPAAGSRPITTSCCCSTNGRRGRRGGGEEGEERGLIVCGSVLQGICDRRSLANVSELLYTTSDPVDTQYVAANDPRVSTVAVVITTASKQEAGGRLRLMLVGRGYTSRGPGDVPPVTARRLAPTPPPRLAFSQEEELGKLVVGSYSEYNNRFVYAFRHGAHAYFLLARRDTRHRKEYLSFVARLCVSDRGFYSYVELPLLCKGGYNLARGARLAPDLARPALFITMAKGQASTPVATDHSALCVYGMAELDEMLSRTQEVCYSQEGRGSSGLEEAYIEYAVSSVCLRLPAGSPIASSIPLPATPTITMTTQLTAITTATEAGHTIALLGDKEGNLHKVLVGSDWSGKLYDSVQVDQGSEVRELLLDRTREHAYVLTSSKVSRLPVAWCERKTGCQACLSLRDPYCGWCVLEGKCSRQHECSRNSSNHWLWSFETTNQCVSIQSLEPANQSRDVRVQVTLTVAHLPTLSEQDALSCAFGLLPRQQTVVTGTTINCQSPSPELLPARPTGSDHLTLPVSLMFGHVTIASTHMTFYDCGAVGQLNTSSPCMACVSSVWECNWCPLDQTCSSDPSCQHALHNHKVQPGSVASCPVIVSLLSSALVPTAFPTALSLLGRNLDLFPGEADYVCVVVIEGFPFYLNATVEKTDDPHYLYCIFMYPGRILIYLPCKKCSRYLCNYLNLCLPVRLYDCSAYGCVWCTGSESSSCAFNQSCAGIPADTCPPPHITEVVPVSGPLEGGVLVTIWGSNLGVRPQDLEGGVSVVGEPCTPKPDKYLISTRIVCELQPAVGPKEGPVLVTVGTHRPGRSSQLFTYRDPQVVAVVPSQGPVSGGTLLTIQGQRLLTGLTSDLTAYVGLQPCSLVEQVSDSRLVCRTGPSEGSADVPVRIVIGRSERTVADALYRYLDDPVITDASPSESFYEGGRVIQVIGSSLDVVQQYIMCTMSIVQYITRWKINNQKLLSLPLSLSPSLPLSLCTLMSPSLPLSLRGYISLPLSLPLSLRGYISLPLSPHLPLWGSLSQGQVFSYHPNPELFVLNRETPDGVGLTRAVSRGEVVVRLGDEECEVKTLDDTHLYCEPPEEQPSSLTALDLPSLTVGLGNLQVDLGVVQYDSSPSPIPLAAQLGLGAGAAVVVLSVLVVILMYRRKSKQALRDYKKVLLQLETLEINVGDQCRKEPDDGHDGPHRCGRAFPALLDFQSYAQRVFFPGQQGALLSQKLDVPETRRAAVEQGLSGLHKLLNNKAFLIKFIHTLEAQQGFSQRDRGYVASLLTVALHDKLEYFTEVMKTLLQHLVLQYASKNPKLMLRRTETVVEKMLTNWMSICLYSFLKEVAGEPLYMLFRAIKYQVDKGPVDAVTGRAKRTLNDSHLLREDIDYRPMTLSVLVKNDEDVQPCPVRVLDTDTITQVKEKILDQTYKGAAFSQRPSAHALDLEWRSGQAGHLTLSDDDVTAIVQGRWKKLNTLQHYKVPDGATVALIPASQASTKGSVHQVYQTAEKTPILEEEEEVRLWHLVKSSEEPDAPRRSSMRERERAKAIPEIYLTRLLSMKGTLQKFVDDVFVAILNTKRPPPIAVRFFFDFLDDMAEKHAIDDPETVHIWKTNSLPLRFWVNILKNPQFVFDVQVTDSIDAVLSVIAQTFIDSCTTSEHKVGRDSPVNKLLYAREIPRYKQMVERYYSDIHSAASGCYQEMNSTLTGLSGSFASEMSSLVALHELYKYINKYYDKVMSSLDEDSGGQKMQLAYRLQQVAALLENKVTDL